MRSARSLFSEHVDFTAVWPPNAAATAPAPIRTSGKIRSASAKRCGTRLACWRRRSRRRRMRGGRSSSPAGGAHWPFPPLPFGGPNPFRRAPFDVTTGGAGGFVPPRRGELRRRPKIQHCAQRGGVIVLTVRDYQTGATPTLLLVGVYTVAAWSPFHHRLIGAAALVVGLAIVAVALLAVGWAWWQSKRETEEMRQMDEEFAKAAAAASGIEHESIDLALKELQPIFHHLWQLIYSP